MSDFMSNYFGPLSKDYCVYFYLMSIIFFIIMLLGLVGVVSTIILKPKQVNMMFFIRQLCKILPKKIGNTI